LKPLATEEIIPEAEVCINKSSEATTKIYRATVLWVENSTF